jgi:hypothetical protein
MEKEPNRIFNIKIKRKLLLDIILIFILIIIVYIYASAHDILEQIVDFSTQHENLEIDEFLTVSIFLVFALLIFSFRRWLEIRDINDTLFDKNKDLEKALSEIKRLRGILPICAECKRIRDDAGYWHQVELYVREHTEAEFSHSICPDCIRKLYPEFIKEKNNKD